jgi:predicted nucleotidyltransferase component of viral defense system
MGSQHQRADRGRRHMISREYIQAWKTNAPWGSHAQVEQDLIISRALCEIYSEKKIRDTLAFRGGTSLQKIFFEKPARYSEDIDLVQIPKEKMGDVAGLVRSKLEPWLGKPQVDRKPGRFTMRFKFDSTEQPVQKMKLKVEVNIAEHFTVFGHETKTFSMESDFYSGECKITTFSIEEIMGTKLRALYQRKKGRDLFDFDCVFRSFPKISNENIIQCFLKYMDYGGHKITRKDFEMALYEKRIDPDFTSDMSPLLPEGSDNFDFEKAFDELGRRLISLVPGSAWPGPQQKKETLNTT